MYRCHPAEPSHGDWNPTTLWKWKIHKTNNAGSSGSQTSVKYAAMALSSKYGCHSHWISTLSSIAITLYSMRSPTNWRRVRRVERSRKNKWIPTSQQSLILHETRGTMNIPFWINFSLLDAEYVFLPIQLQIPHPEKTGQNHYKQSPFSPPRKTQPARICTFWPTLAELTFPNKTMWLSMNSNLTIFHSKPSDNNHTVLFAMHPSCCWSKKAPRTHIADGKYQATLLQP